MVLKKYEVQVSNRAVGSCGYSRLTGFNDIIAGGLDLSTWVSPQGSDTWPYFDPQKLQKLDNAYSNRRLVKKRVCKITSMYQGNIF